MSDEKPARGALDERLELRPARDEDLPGAARLAAALTRLHHAWDDKRFFVVRGLEAGYQRFLGEELRNPDARVLVAVRDGAVLGYAYATLEPRNWSDLRDACGKLHDVYVDEAARGSGLAERLVREACAWLRARGAPRVVLMVADKNAAGQRLFARVGFRPTMHELTLELDEDPTRA